MSLKLHNQNKSCIRRWFMHVIPAFFVVILVFVVGFPLEPFLEREITTQSLSPVLNSRQGEALKIYRSKQGIVQACVIPNFCSIEPVMGIGQEYYVSDKYQGMADVILNCLPPSSKLLFYSGKQPKHDRIMSYDVHALGRSLVSEWYRHFPHMAWFLVGRVLPSVSLFRTNAANFLTYPDCIYPQSKYAAPCHVQQSQNPSPRVVISQDVYNSTWNRQMFDMLNSSTADGKPLFHVESKSTLVNESYMECVSSAFVTPNRFDSHREGHDAIFRASGIDRAANCNQLPRIVIVVRRPGSKRSIGPKSLQSLKAELPKHVNATIEWIEGLYMSFPDQVKLMQRADVLVSVHGAELSNVLFLREGARVVEIMPFGFNHPLFKWMAKSVHAELTNFPSYPDPYHFQDCLKRLANNQSELLAKFSRQVSQFRSASSWEERKRIAFDGPLGGIYSTCARYQHVELDVHRLVSLIAAKTRNQCAKSIPNH